MRHHHTSRWVWAILTALVMVGSIVFLAYSLDMSASRHALPTKSLVIGAYSIQVEIANTPQSREQGLSGRSSLPEGKGMFFVFDQPAYWSFWMKDMRFAIDIIWIDAGRRIVDIDSNVSPDTYPQAFAPSVPAQYVLEVPAGFAAKHGIAVGQKIVVQ